ncbi:unnamed protein product [Polarella glacialis]|uniref:Uncharacterized protein n=1 Tax=Polarella glacialis TaxID=89957 RepID=A0A813GJG3_POLGL|nr:unnamed protein product [Polarella glacialis]
MWLRDSSVQNEVYLPLAARSDSVYSVLLSIMKRQVRVVYEDIYGSAFYSHTGRGRDEGPNKEQCLKSRSCPNCCCDTCQPACGPFTYQLGFELDASRFVVSFTTMLGKLQAKRAIWTTSLQLPPGGSWRF